MRAAGIMAFFLAVAWEQHGREIVTVAAVLAALGVIYRAMVRPVMQFGRRIDKALGAVEKELQPNGGSSLRDAVNRVESVAGHTSVRVEELHQRHDDLARRLDAAEDLLTQPKRSA